MINELTISDILDRDRDDVVDWAWRLTREERAQVLDPMLDVIRTKSQPHCRRLHAAAALQAMPPHTISDPIGRWSGEETGKTLGVLGDLLSSSEDWELRKASALAILAVLSRGVVTEASLQRGRKAFAALLAEAKGRPHSEFAAEALGHFQAIARQHEAASAPATRHVRAEELLDLIAGKLGLSKVAAKRLVQGMLDSIVDRLLDAGRIELRDFGVFEVKQRRRSAANSPKRNRTLVFKPSVGLEKRLK